MYKDEFFIRWNYHLLAAPGYVVLMTNYTGSTGFGEAFAQAIQGDPLAGPADEINQAADEAIRRYPFIDASRQAAGGASYGGHLTNWLAVSTERYRALVSHAGLYDLKTQWTTSDIAYSRERNLGGPPWQGNAVWKDQSAFWRSKKLKTPILVTFRRARLPRSVQQRPRILDRAATAAGREPARDLPRREPLDTEGREQPLLLQGSPGLASEALRVAQLRGDCHLRRRSSRAKETLSSKVTVPSSRGKPSAHGI